MSLQQNGNKFGVDRAIVAGSMGKYTSIERFYDVDLVIFIKSGHHLSRGLRTAWQEDGAWREEAVSALLLLITFYSDKSMELFSGIC